MSLIAGGLCVLAASFLGGVTGFGYSLVATPLLLLLGFPLPFVVTVNLALAFVTRIPVAYRFRANLDPRRVAGLIAGSVPACGWASRCSRRCRSRRSSCARG